MDSSLFRVELSEALEQAIEHEEAGDDSGALDRLHTAVNILRLIGAHDSECSLLLLLRMGGLARRVGDLDEADKVLTEAIELSKSIHGYIGKEALGGLNDLALILMERREYERAIKVLSEGEAAARAKPEDPAQLVLMLTNKGAVLHALSKYGAALQCVQEAEVLARRTMGEWDPHYGKVLEALGQCYRSVGDLPLAKEQFERALVIFSESLGGASRESLASKCNIGHAQMDLGEYAEAEATLVNTLEAQAEHLGESDLDTIHTVKTLGVLYKSLGDYEGAYSYLSHAVNLYGTLLGEAHPNYARALDTLADLYIEMGWFAEAERHYLHCLSVFAATPGVDSEEYAASLTGLARAYDYQNRFGDSEKSFQQAVAILRRILGAQHSTLASALHSLGRLYYVMGRYDDAVVCFQQSLDAEPPSAPMLAMSQATTLTDLALVHGASGSPVVALSLLNQAEAIHDGLIAQVFTLGTEEQRMAFLSKIEWRRDVFLTLVWRYLDSDHQAQRDAFELLLRRKAIGAEMLSLLRFAAKKADEPTQRVWQELSIRRRKLTQQKLSSALTNQQHADARDLDEMDAERRWLEKELAKGFSSPEILEVFTSKGMDAIAVLLDDATALVELCISKHFP